VYLDEEANAVPTDMVIIVKENADIIKEPAHGVPDIIIDFYQK